MKRYSLLAGCVLCAVALMSVPAMADGPIMITGHAIKHDTSPPLRELAARTPMPTGMMGLNKEVPVMTRPGQLRPDPGDQTISGVQRDATPTPNFSPTPPVDISAPGLTDDDNAATIGGRVVPPDTNGDIGFDDAGNKIYIQYINLIWGIYDATDGSPIGVPMAGNTFWAGFGGPCQTNNNGDPIVLYDDQAGRWMFSQFSIGEGIQCVAVSQTSDPLGPYHRYAFVVTPGGNNDYPKMGVWDDGTTGSTGQSAYTFTTRDFGVAGFIGEGVMERDAMLVGGAAQFIKFQMPCSAADCREGTIAPHLAGPPPPAGTCPTFFTIFDAAFDDGPSGVDGVRTDTLCVDWATIGNSTNTENAFAPGASIDRFLGNGFSDCISPIPAPGEVLDCLAIFTLYRAQYRWWGSHASVVLNSTVDIGANRGGIYWNEMRSTDGDSGWTIDQDGTFGPADDFDRWMGSIAMDGDMNIALGYSKVDGTNGVLPNVSYTTRMDSSPPGVLDGGEEICHQGTGVQTSSANRWGDYSSMSIDPEDDCTFWYTQEYYETTGSFDFATRICSFKLADCGGGGCNLRAKPRTRRARRGRPMPVVMRILHNRNKTVTTPFQISVRDKAGVEYASKVTAPITLTLGQQITHNDTINLPSSMAPGEYELVVHMDEMRGGREVSSRTFRVR